MAKDTAGFFNVLDNYVDGNFSLTKMMQGGGFMDPGLLNQLRPQGQAAQPMQAAPAMQRPPMPQIPQMAQGRPPGFPQMPFMGMLSGNPGMQGLMQNPAFQQWMSQRPTSFGNGQMRQWMQQRPQLPGMPQMMQRPQMPQMPQMGQRPRFPMGFGG